MPNAVDLNKLLHLFVYDPQDPLLFGTSFFLFLFLGLLIIYRIFDSNKNLRIISVLIFSLFFYYKAAGPFFVILIVSAVFNFFAGKIIGNTKTGTTKRLLLLIITLVINLGSLGYFKYTNFFFEILNDIHLGKFEPLDIFLPIGISFYTFKALLRFNDPGESFSLGARITRPVCQNL